MMFSLFEPPAGRHLRKSREYLEDAKIKRVEHEAAAEHHRALTELYAERISRIELELSQALQSTSGSHPLDMALDSKSVIQASDSVLVYSPRASRA